MRPQDSLFEYAQANQTPAERKLELFNGEWKGDIDRVFLTGGTSFVPAVRRLFEQRFARDRIESGDELLSIANGLAFGITAYAALKLLETRNTRDELVLVGAGFFLLLAAYLAVAFEVDVDRDTGRVELLRQSAADWAHRRLGVTVDPAAISDPLPIRAPGSSVLRAPTVAPAPIRILPMRTTSPSSTSTVP